MKLSTSALKHFLFCATATAVVSTSFGGERQSNSAADIAEEETKHYYYNYYHKEQEQHKSHQQTALLYDQNGFDTTRHSDLGIHDHHPRDRNGALTSLPTGNQTAVANKTNSTRTPCHPDLGVLACPRKGQQCRKTSRSAQMDAKNKTIGWHCVGEHETETSRSLIFEIFGNTNQHFPPSGPKYDECTYDKGYTYIYNSTIRYPSAWDVCVCKEYEYSLPNGESPVYNDVEYCHDINKFFCANYYDKDAGHDPNAYDACLCSTYDGNSIPGKPNDFCDELPKRYCEDYYAYGDVVGIARCLCDTFGYDDWCDFEPPEGFVPVAPPTPGPPTTRQPTLRPTREPTKKPTRRPTREPTINPTHIPTNKPSKTPTETPTFKPAAKPTIEIKPTNPPVPSIPPTPTPTTMFPTRTIFTPKPTSDPTVPPTISPTKEPTAAPTSNPTARPTNAPKPTPMPVDFILVDENVFHKEVLDVNKIDTVMTTLKRQPSLSKRPGESLRLSAPDNVFRRKTQTDDVDE